MTDHVNEAMIRLTRYQLARGFSYWPVSATHAGSYSDWGSSYMGHFLIEAKERGYHVPPDLFDHWYQDAENRAKRLNRKNHRYQTYRLFVLALSGKSHMGAMNLIRENYLNELDPLSRKLLAAAYYVSGQKNTAREIDTSVSDEIVVYREMGGTYGSDLRDLALTTYLCMKMDDLETASRLLQRVYRNFTSGGWYSTQETAMVLLCMGTYYKMSPFSGGSVHFHMHKEGAGSEKMTLDGYQMMVDLQGMWDKRITVTSDDDNPLFINLLVEGVPLEDRIQTAHHGIQLVRSFYNEEGLPITVDRRQQGAPFWIVYQVQSLTSAVLENLALSSILPAAPIKQNPS